MVMTRAFGAAALAVLLGTGVAAQQPADPMQGMLERMQSMEAMMQQMHHMMMSMHDGGAGQPGEGMMMRGAEGMPGMMNGMPGMQGAPETPAMHGAAPGAAPQGCLMGSDSGIAALFLGPVTDLGLTDAQRSTLEDVLVRARAEALSALAPEQQARVEAFGPAPTGPMCPDGQGVHPPN
jgi:hypothetical protein